MFVTSPSLFLSRRFEDLFWKDLGQLKWLWEFILALIWRKTRSVLRSRFSTALWVPFGTVFGAPGPPKRNPFGSLFGSCCHPEAPWGWKLRILGGSGRRVFFQRDFVSFLEGSWAVKTLISHGRGSKNHNFTEVRIPLLFGSILGVILEPKSL